MTIRHQTVLGEDGKPVAAQIPWDEFERICAALEDTLPTSEEAEAIAEAQRDREAGSGKAFTDLTEVQAQFAS